ncbi:MAG: hypothetical protein ABGX16_05155 [Pirellulales bacterium]
MDLHFLNRLVPCLMIAVALGAHFTYCEWDFNDDPRSVSSEQHQRAIYFHHSHSQDVYLLAKSLAEKDKAQHFGVLLPIVLAVIAIGMLQLTGENRSQHGTHAGI